MKKILYILLILPINLLAQSPIDTLATDSLKIYYAKPVEVRAERISYQSKLNTQSKIRIADIQTGSKLQVSDVLSDVPGLYVKDYGGMGGMKTVSLRGCGSNQTAVTINGMNINSSANGSLDFSNMPTSLFSELNVMRGGLSSYVGSGSLGGVVDLKLNTDTEQSYGGTLSYGSYNTFNADANYSDSLFNTTNRIAMSYSHSKGDMKIETVQFGETIETQRTNAEFDNIALSYSNRYAKGDFQLNSFLLTNHSKRGVPGAVVQGVLENTNANLTDDKLTAILSSDYVIDNDNMFNISGLFSIGKSVYSDSLNLKYNMPLEATYDDTRYNLKIEYNNKIGDTRNSLNTSVLFDSKLDYLVGTMLETKSEENVYRFTNALFAGCIYNHNFQNSMMKSRLDISNVKINSGVRIENMKDDFFVAPSFGTSLNLPYIRSQIGGTYTYNYRLPTFNELYYLNYGNTDLEPEFSHSFNLNYIFEYRDYVNLSVSGFVINTIDKIVAVPKSPVAWSVVNMGEVLSHGLELSTYGKYDNFMGSWDYSLSYTFQKVTDEADGSPSKGKQLIYTPQEIIATSLRYKKRWFFSGISGQYVSHRYYQADNTYESLMKSYVIFNAYAGVKIKKDYGSFEFVLSAQSSLGEAYQVIHNYPMENDKIFFSIKFQK